MACFLDQNRFLHGSDLNGVRIIKPEDCPEDTGTVFVGLNPLNARQIISSVESLQSRNLTFYFLD